MGERQGLARRTLFATVIVGAVLGATFLTIDPAAAATSYDDYVLFGEHGVTIGQDSTVTGLVGARFNPAGGDSLNMAGGAYITGDARAGADVRMQNNAGISGALYRVGTFTGTASSFVGANNLVADADLPGGPIPRQWPGGAAAAQSRCAVNNAPDYVPGGNGHELTLAPGSYGTIDLNANSTLTFGTAGDYFVDAISMGGGTTLNFADGVRLFVCSKFGIGNGTFNGPADPSDLYVEVQGAGADGFGFEVGNLHWTGNVVVPNGGFHIGSGGSQSSLEGHVWADFIDLEHSVEVRDTTTTSTSTSTSTSTTVPASTSTSTSTTSTSTSTTSTTVPDTTSTSTTSTSTTSTSVPDTTTTSTSTSTTSTTVPDTTTTSTSTSTTSTTVPDTTTTSTSTSTSTSVPDTTTTTVADTTTTTVSDTTTTTAPSSSTTVAAQESTTTTSSDLETQGATIPTTTTTTTTTPRITGRLPITGSDAFAQLFFGLSLLAGGALLAFRARRGLNRS